MQALPIDDCLDELKARLHEARAVLVEAPPGAGKSTRAPLAVAAALGCWGPARAAEQTEGGVRQVWVSEPRRVAARLLAYRVAAELGEPVGERVGYAVRFERRVSPRTRIVYATTGVLLQELLATPGAALPPQVAAVILDEVHERSVETDLLLALLRRELTQSAHLKLVAMSATLDAAPIAHFLGEELPGGCPSVTSAGRSYPVRVLHDEAPDERPLERRVASAVKRQLREGPAGDVLVFLPGAGEIRAAASTLAPLTADGVEVLPLHGELPLSEQSQALSPGAWRRVILSTNVAESSVTVPGTTNVVDSGLARVARHSLWSGVTSLKVEPISRASAEQRAGRAGRTAPGEVFRLYSALELSQRPSHLAPEILRADLADLALQLGRAGLTPDELRWLSPPEPSAFSEAYALLARLGATAPGGRQLTLLGRRMAALPLPPRASRVALAAVSLGVGESGALAATLLTERDPRLRDDFERRRAQSVRSDSDLDERMERLREAMAGGLDRRACRAAQLAYEATTRIARSLRQLTRLLQVEADECPLSEVPARLSQALLLGYPDRVAGRRSGKALVLTSGQAARLAEESVVHDAPLLIALEASAGARGAVVTLACATSEEHLFEHFPERVSDQDTLNFNPETARVELTARLYYGSICLDERRHAAPPSAAATQVLTAWVLERGLSSLDPDDRLGELAARTALLSKLHPELHAPTTREALLTLALEGAINLAGLDAGELERRALAALPGEQLAQLERELPRALRLPSGVRHQVRYAAGQEPWVEARLQDFFGCLETPRIASGRLPLTLHLLAPNRRAVQITQDLAGFWQRGYPELRRQLSRRYPKHAWPEDGATAKPPAPRPRPR